MLEEIKNRLGANYIDNTDDTIVDIIKDVTSIATDFSNRESTDEKLIPYIKKAVVSEYLQRGAEGLLSRNEGGISSSFNDIEEKLKKDLLQVRIIK